MHSPPHYAETVHPLQVCETTHPLCPPHPNTTVALFNIPVAPSYNLHVGLHVQLRIPCETEYSEEPDKPRYYGTLGLEIAGPIMGVRRQDAMGVEFVVKNEVEGAQIKYAHLRIPQVRTYPTEAEFAAELGRRLEALACANHEGDMDVTPDASEAQEAPETPNTCYDLRPISPDSPPEMADDSSHEEERMDTHEEESARERVARYLEGNFMWKMRRPKDAYKPWVPSLLAREVVMAED